MSEAGAPREGATRIVEGARDAALRAAASAREMAAKAVETAGEATSTAVNLAAGVVSEFAHASRQAQAALFEDARAAISAFETMLGAATLTDAAQIQIDFLSGRARKNVERARAVAEYVAKTVSDRQAAARPGPAEAAPPL